MILIMKILIMVVILIMMIFNVFCISTLYNEQILSIEILHQY